MHAGARAGVIDRLHAFGFSSLQVTLDRVGYRQRGLSVGRAPKRGDPRPRRLLGLLVREHSGAVGCRNVVGQPELRLDASTVGPA